MSICRERLKVVKGGEQGPLFEVEPEDAQPV
ncbi:hypothetical protein CGLO_02532 [Colletotrichum gloeosporioides Cg-14]|uniref:Uncharacterized protein n=1 Tax=Colletotrichum gloeosporioides (strain Cg-14) TaxID=1237896 RepID=T0M0Q1_COLGC|nr:hypothetical protein CGLO_02532 [Colletotrichum gloeosporioides Cg-14]